MNQEKTDMISLLNRLKQNKLSSQPDGAIVDLQKIQETLFGWFSFVIAAGFTVAMAVITFLLQTALFPLWVGIAIVVLVWLSVSQHLLPYQVRVVFQLLLIMGLIVLGLFSLGVVGASAIGLLSILILSAVFSHKYFSTALLVVSTLLLLLIGWQISVGNIVLDREQIQSISNGALWVSNSFRFSIQIIILVSIIAILVRSARSFLQRQRALTQEVLDRRNSLENLVRENTRALEITARLSQNLSNFLDQHQLITEVVGQIQRTFHYYHVHIYLVNDYQSLIMAGGTGEAGSALLIGKHKIAIGDGVVGLAAQKKEIVLVQNVHLNDAWLPNTLLPETQSEIAVPIMLEGELLGVLDVQDSEKNRFSQTDIDLLSTITLQFAIASRNAALYEQVQDGIKHQARINQVGEQIQLSPNVSLTLHTAAREIYHSLNANRVGITLFPKALRPQNSIKEEA